jgi:hypothetical protein
LDARGGGVQHVKTLALQGQQRVLGVAPGLHPSPHGLHAHQGSAASRGPQRGFIRHLRLTPRGLLCRRSARSLLLCRSPARDALRSLRLPQALARSILHSQQRARALLGACLSLSPRHSGGSRLLLPAPPLLGRRLLRRAGSVDL